MSPFIRYRAARVYKRPRFLTYAITVVFATAIKRWVKEKRLVPYSDSESDDESPKEKYLKKEESDSEDDFLPKKKHVRMIDESDSEDDIFSPKKNPSQMNDEKNLDMRNLYDFNDVLNKKIQEI